MVRKAAGEGEDFKKYTFEFGKPTEAEKKLTPEQKTQIRDVLDDLSCPIDYVPKALKNPAQLPAKIKECKQKALSARQCAKKYPSRKDQFIKTAEIWEESLEILLIEVEKRPYEERDAIQKILEQWTASTKQVEAEARKGPSLKERFKEVKNTTISKTLVNKLSDAVLKKFLKM